MAGYTRNDTANNIADGNIINASDLDGEFDAVQSAFNASTGHTHDGTSGEGAPIEQVGPVQDLVITASEVKPKTTNTLDLGTSLLQFKNLYIEGSAYIDGLGESMLVDGSSSIQFRDSALAINSSTDGQLDIDADTELELTAPTVDINASTSVNISNDLKLDSDSAILSLGADSEVTLTHLHNVGTELKVVNATTSSVTDILDLQVESSGTPAVGIGTGLTFSTETSSGNVEVGGAVRSIATGLTPTAEEIDLVFYSMRNGSLTEAFRYDSAQDRLEITGGASVTADVNFGDNDKAIFGAGSDLEIYHDSATGHSIISEVGSGSLQLRGTNIQLKNADNTKNYIAMTNDGDVDLYYDNSVKLSTTSTGIDVTGTVTADGLTVDTNSTTGAVKIQSGDNNTFGIGLAQIAFGYNGTDDYQHFIRTSADIVDSGNKLEFLLCDGTQNNTLTSGTTRALTLTGNGDIAFYEDTGTTAKLFWDASAESLGIGTTSPAQLAHLFEATADTGAFLQVQETGGQNAYFGVNTSGGSIQVSGANPLQIATNGTERMRIDSSGTTFGTRYQNFTGSSDPWFKGTDAGGIETSFIKKDGSAFFSGNLGIGTTSPASIVEIIGVNPKLTINANDVVNGRNATLSLISGFSGDPSGTCQIMYGASNSITSGTLTFVEGDGTTERMRIDSSGNVGIGVTPFASTSSFAKLEIKNYTGLVDNSGGGGGYALLGNAVESSVNAFEYRLNYFATMYRTFAGQHQWHTAPSGTAGNAITFDQAMTLDASGNLGIGTTSPDRNLHIAGNAAYAKFDDTVGGDTFTIGSNANGFIVYDDDAASYRMVIDSSGNVGIGTETATGFTKTLRLNTASGTAGMLLCDADTDRAGFYIDAGTTAPAYLFTNNSKPLVFSVAGSERMRIDSSGRLLLGTSTNTDNYRLQVDSAVNSVAQFTRYAADGADVVIGSSRGTVGSKTALNINDIAGQISFKAYQGTAFSPIASINAVCEAAPASGDTPGILVFSTTADGESSPTERMRIDSSGNVGIGASPSAKLDIVSGSDNANTLLLSDTDANLSIKDGFVTSRHYTNSEEPLAMIQGRSTLSTNEVLIGGTHLNTTYNVATEIKFYTAANTTTTGSTTQERMRIDSIGNLLFQDGSALAVGLPSLQVGGSAGNALITVRRNTTSGASQLIFYNPNGIVGSINTNGSSTAYNTSSDYRLKENVVDMTGAIDRVKALNPSQFNFIADPDKTVDGFLAHEVSDVVPEAVTGTKDAMRTEEYEVTPAVLDDDGNVVTEAVMGTREVPDYQGIDQSKLVPLLTGALQEAIARIETLEAQVATLQGN